MRRVKILRVIARLNIGGPAVHVINLCAGLDPQRFETTLVCGGVGQHEGDMGYLAAAAGVHPVLMPALQRAIAPLADLAALLQLYKLMRRIRPEIVDTHTFKAGALGRVAAWLAGVPVRVHTFHGHVFQGYGGWLQSALIAWLERGLGRLTTRVFSVSQLVNDDLLARRIVPASKLRVFPVVLDLAPFASAALRGAFRAELGIAAGVALVGNIGRLVPIKNQALFLQIAALLVQRGFGGKFVLVGDGELRAELEQRARVLQLSDRIYFCGWRRDLAGVLADIDVMVNTSLNEGTPVAIIEAMAARVPVVATSVGGVPDLVIHGSTGFLVPAESAEACAAAVEVALRADPVLLDRAQRFALETYDLQRSLQRAEALYLGLLPNAL